MSLSCNHYLLVVGKTRTAEKVFSLLCEYTSEISALRRTLCRMHPGPPDHNRRHPPCPASFTSTPHQTVRKTHVLMPQMLQQLQLSVSPLAQHGGREGLHDLLDGDGGSSELVLGGAGSSWRVL